MKRTQLNRLMMYQAVKMVLVDNDAAWSGFSETAALINRFNADVERIRMAMQIQEADTIGVTDEKHAQKLVVADLAYKVRCGLLVHARLSKNERLRRLISYSKTDLRAGNDLLCKERYDIILESALKYTADILPHGVDNALLQEFELGILLFDELLGRVRNANNVHKTASSTIKQLMSSLGIYLRDVLDPALFVRFSEETFHEVYLNARIIVNRRSTRGELSDTVIDDAVDSSEEFNDALDNDNGS